MTTPAPFGPFRRIVTSHHPTDTTGDNVLFHDDLVPPRPVLGGNAHIAPLYSQLAVPTTNPHVVTPAHIAHAAAAVHGVVLPGGTNAQFTDLAPNFRVGMHRTNSVDYNVLLKGSVSLIVPDGNGGERRTLVNPGELVVQSGTLHAWEAGPEGARWVTVVVAALPVEKDGKAFGEVDF